MSGCLFLSCEKSCNSTIIIARRTVILYVDILMYIYVKMVLSIDVINANVDLRARTQSIIANMHGPWHTLISVGSWKVNFISGARGGAHGARGTYATRCITMFDRCAVQIKILFHKIVD